MSAFFWLSESRQASIDMTGDDTASALQRLLSICSTFDERDAILRGWWVWVEESDGEEIRREERVQEFLPFSSASGGFAVLGEL